MMVPMICAAFAAALLTFLAAAVPAAVPGLAGRIIWVSDRDGTPDLYTMDAGGGDVVRLTRDPDREEYPKVSPDRAQVAFISSRSGKRELWVMPLAPGAAARQLTRSPDSLEVMEPDWSPGGTAIAYNVVSLNLRDPKAARVVGEVWRMDADGAGARRLIEAAGLHFNPVFSPDGKRLLAVANDFATYFDHPLAPHLFDARGGGRRRLTAGFDAHAAWCGPGHIVYVNFPDRSVDSTATAGIWRLAVADCAAAGAAERLTPVEWQGSPRLPNADPSGRWLVFTADPQGKAVAEGEPAQKHYDVFELDLESHDLRRLTDDEHMDEGAWWY